MSAARVLIVDDNAMNIDIASAVLTAEDFVVDSAADAIEAQRKIVSFKPDLVLMDIQLPGMDGVALTRLMKADPTARHIVVVAFTAFAMSGDEAKMRAAGCDGYLSKPIEVKRFGAQVRAFMEGGRPMG